MNLKDINQFNSVELLKYKLPNFRKSVWQLVSSLGIFSVLWILMYYCMQWSYLLVLLFAIPAGGMVIRIFIMFHDCCHGSFFSSRHANNFWGRVLSVLVITPYHCWRYEHALHHAHAGNLDKRGHGDLWLLTVNEYLTAPLWKRFIYRTYRNPLMFFLITPPIYFLLLIRFPQWFMCSKPRQKNSIHLTNIAIAAVFFSMSMLIGARVFFAIEIPVIVVASWIGVWLFSIQHNFEQSQWYSHSDWDSVKISLRHSSYYKLPRVLQWFTGNIGFHHVHHMDARIPNYYLPSVHQSHPLLKAVQSVTFWNSLKAMRLHLWDEEKQKLVGFCELKNQQTG